MSGGRSAPAILMQLASGKWQSWVGLADLACVITVVDRQRLAKVPYRRHKFFAEEYCVLRL